MLAKFRCRHGVLGNPSVKRPILCLVGIVSAFGITAATAQAAGTTSVSTVPASVTISPSAKALIQACVGEPVVFSGDSLVVVHETTLPDGSVQFVIHRNGMGGVTTGATYRVGGRIRSPSSPLHRELSLRRSMPTFPSSGRAGCRAFEATSSNT